MPLAMEVSRVRCRGFCKVSDERGLNMGGWYERITAVAGWDERASERT